MAIELVLYTGNQYFLNQFKLSLGEERRLFAVSSFADRDKARGYVEQNAKKVCCILADESFFAALNSSGTFQIRLGEETVFSSDLDTDYAELNIYQRKTQILEDLKQLLRMAQLLTVKGSSERATRILTFFSTQGGSGVSTLAYLTALRGSERGKTVYLNLEIMPCTEVLYKDDGALSAEMFLVSLKEHGDQRETLLSALHRNEHGVYVLPTPISMADQQSLTQEDIRCLLDGLLEGGDIAWIIVDLSGGLTPRNEYALSMSNRVVLVYRDDPAGTVKRDRLLRDPSYPDFPFADREILAMNQCRKQYSEEEDRVFFPYSESIMSGRDKKMLLEGNYAIAEGCDKLLQIDDRV